MNKVKQREVRALIKEVENGGTGCHLKVGGIKLYYNDLKPLMEPSEWFSGSTIDALMECVATKMERRFEMEEYQIRSTMLYNSWVVSLC